MMLEQTRQHSSGPFAERVVARDQETGREVLVSLPRVNLVGAEEGLRERVLAAARRYRGLVHPHICAPLDAGFLKSGQLCIVQELPDEPKAAGGAEGERALVETGPATLLHLSEALAYAHTRGLPHGALTRDCVVGAGTEAPRLADFGVAAALLEAGVLAERAADAESAAPEARAGGEPSSAGDVYSLGVVGIDLAVGGSDAGQPLSARAGRVPGSGLSATLARAIEPDPPARFANGEEVLRQLRAVVAPVPTQPKAPAPRRTRRRKEPPKPAVPEMSHLKATGLMLWATVRSVFTLIVALALILGAVAGGLALAFRETPALVIVPPLEGKTVAQARELAQTRGLEVEVARRAYHDEVPEGEIIEQTPYARKTVRSGRSIELVVSRGAPRVKVPKLVGLPRAEAKQLLEAAGLSLGTVSRKKATGEPDRVLSQNPQPGAEVAVSREVNIMIAVSKKQDSAKSDKKGPRAADVTVVVPQGPARQRVKVEVHYPNARYTKAYDKVHKPGDSVTVRVLASGPASVQTLIDGKLVAEDELESSS